MTHPDVADAAVPGVHHPSRGAESKAYVAPVTGSAVTTPVVLERCPHRFNDEILSRTVCVVPSLSTIFRQAESRRPQRGWVR